MPRRINTYDIGLVRASDEMVACSLGFNCQFARQNYTSASIFQPQLLRIDWLAEVPLGSGPGKLRYILAELEVLDVTGRHHHLNF